MSVSITTINVSGKNVSFFATHLDDAASSNRVTGCQAGFANGDQTGVPKPAPLLKLMLELRSSQGFL